MTEQDNGGQRPDTRALLARIEEIEGQVRVHDTEDGANDVRGLVSAVLDLARSLVDQDRNGPGSGNVVSRALIESVARPLVEVLRTSSGSGHPHASQTEDWPGFASSNGGSPDDRLWDLAKTATHLRRVPECPTGLLEAVAALQALALQPGPDRDSRVAELTDLQAGLMAGILASLDGPYLVTNAESLCDHLGLPVPTTPQMALCRCGESKNKPFCDGSHAWVRFSDAKDPKRVADRRDSYVGQQITISDNRGICAHSGFCTDRLASVFHVDAEPFVTPSGGRMDEIIRAVRACPSGALSIALDGEELRDHVDVSRPPNIEVSKDGPYRVTGGIPLVDADGNPEPRVGGASTEHYSLCRCGHSQNKPFCSGMHWYVDFHDPLQDPNRTPTVFEWCGGFPALTRDRTRMSSIDGRDHHVQPGPGRDPSGPISGRHPHLGQRWRTKGRRGGVGSGLLAL